MDSMTRLFYRRILMLTIAMGVIITFIAIYGPQNKQKKVIFIHEMHLDMDSGMISITKGMNPTLDPVLTGQIGFDLYNYKEWSYCDAEQISRPHLKTHCPHVADLTIKHRKEGDASCFKVSWKSLSSDFIPMDCVNVEDAHWYGGAEVLHDKWTIEKQPMKMQHFLSNDIGMVLDGYGNVLERYWLSSRGISVVIDDEVPLHVSVNHTKICFKADYANSWYHNPKSALPTLNYQLCVADNVLEAHLHVTKMLFTPAKQIPKKALFHKPIWSTWAQFRSGVTQAKVLAYAREIKKNGFEGCQVEIDDGYTKHYGDFEFDSNKFPNPKAMSKELANLGFDVTIWITPFTNPDSDKYKEGVSKGYFIKSRTNNFTVKWWRGHGAVLDLTNPDAVLWMKARLQSFQQQGVTSFKFDAAESNLLPNQYITKNLLQNSNHYSRLYAYLMHNITLNRQIEVRVGYRSQSVPVMTRMMDKDSVWGYERGLQSLIPTALLFGILGYPFVLPDMVGGNGKAGQVVVEPEKELYLRWVAATIMLPFVQFSIPPWKYDKDTVNVTHQLLKIRKLHLPNILQAAQTSAKTALPIVRPVWWVDPGNQKTHDIDSQFLVGDSILVAPILQKGDITRDIYLPHGKWTDVKTGKTHKGRTTLKNYRVPLHELPIFKRAQTVKQA